MNEQIALKAQGRRRCYKCKQVMSYDAENFRNDCRCCKRCEREMALLRFYDLKENPTLPRVLKSRLAASKSRAKKKNVPFTLTFEDLLAQWDKQNGKCFYTGLPLKIKIESCVDNKEVVSIDRVEPDKGYSRENVVLCCDCVNTMKSNLSMEQFKGYLSLLHSRLLSSDNKV